MTQREPLSKINDWLSQADATYGPLDNPLARLTGRQLYAAGAVLGLIVALLMMAAWRSGANDVAASTVNVTNTAVTDYNGTPVSTRTASTSGGIATTTNIPPAAAGTTTSSTTTDANAAPAQAASASGTAGTLGR